MQRTLAIKPRIKLKVGLKHYIDLNAHFLNVDSDDKYFIVFVSGILFCKSNKCYNW